MAINPNEEKQNQARVAAGVSPVPYSLISAQSGASRSSGKTKQDDIDFKEFKLDDYKESGFDYATLDFYVNDVSKLKEQERTFYAKWEGIFKDYYGGNESAFVAEMSPFMQQDIAAIYRNKANVEQREGQLVRNWERFNNDNWNKVDDQEPLINMEGGYYAITDLISTEGIEHLKSQGFSEESLKSPLTKTTYGQFLHRLPADTYEVIDYNAPDTKTYWELKNKWISDNVGFIDTFDENGVRTKTNATNLDAALTQWNNMVMQDPELSRVHNSFFNRYAESVEQTYQNLTKEQKVSLDLKRTKFQEMQSIGFENLTPQQQQQFVDGLREVVEYDYSGAAGSSIFGGQTRQMLRGLWEEQMSSLDYDIILESIDNANDPNRTKSSKEKGYSTSLLDKYLTRELDGLPKYNDVATGAIVKSSLNIDVKGYEALDRTKNNYAGKTDFVKLGKAINEAGGIDALDQNLKKDSKVFWENKDYFDQNYLADVYSPELSRIEDTGTFETPDGTYKVSVYEDATQVMDVSAHNIFSTDEDLRSPNNEKFYTVTDPEGNQKTMNIAGLLDIALNDNLKARAGAVDYLADYGAKSGLISQDEAEIAALTKDRQYKQEIQKLEQKVVTKFPMYGKQKLLPGHLEDSNPSYWYYDFRDGKSKPMDIRGVMIYGTEAVFGLNEEDMFINSHVLVDEDQAEKYSIPRPGERSNTNIAEEYPTLEDWMIENPIKGMLLLKELGVNMTTEPGLALYNDFKDRYVVNVPVQISNEMLKIGNAKDKDYKRNKYPQTQEMQFNSTPVYE